MDVQNFVNESGFPADRRFFDGHFPDNPIVPGAVILAYLSQRCAGVGCQVKRIDRVKFMRPLRPEVPFEISVTERNGYQAKFSDQVGVFAQVRFSVTGSDV